MIRTCEDEGQEGNVFVHGDVGIKGDVSVQEGLSQEGDEVTTHGHHQTGVSKHHGTGGATGHCHTISGNTP